MDQLLSSVSIRVNDNIYLKDPESSELGRKIISGAVNLIHELGFEEFTFGKLGRAISSPEASVYRYFENKHTLLIYLISWYWVWIDYRVAFLTANIESPKERLDRAISILVGPASGDVQFTYINEAKLHAIVISESSKSYLNREVDQQNKEGFFGAYKKLVARMGRLILEINSAYKYPHMLISTVIEGAHHQRYFAEHIPNLTNIIKGEDSTMEFYRDLIFKAIQLEARHSNTVPGRR